MQQEEITLKNLIEELDVIEKHIKNNPKSPYVGILEASIHKLKVKITKARARAVNAKRKLKK